MLFHFTCKVSFSYVRTNMFTLKLLNLSITGASLHVQHVSIFLEKCYICLYLFFSQFPSPLPFRLMFLLFSSVVFYRWVLIKIKKKWTAIKSLLLFQNILDQHWWGAVEVFTLWQQLDNTFVTNENNGQWKGKESVHLIHLAQDLAKLFL